MASSRPVFRFYVDWLNDGDFADANDEVTSTPGGNAMAADGLTIAYGRDQARAFSPVRAGEAAFKLNNAARIYSPENSSSPLFGQLVPGRPVQITAGQDPSGSGYVTSPAANANIATNFAVTPGTYTVQWAVSLAGTLSGADVNNFALYNGTTFVTGSVNPAAAGTYPQAPQTFTVTGGAPDIKILSSGTTPTTGSVYGASFNTTVIYRGFLDDYTVSPNKGDRTVTMSCLDLMARFAQANPLSTPLYAGIRTGTAIGLILDALGWPSGARDLDPGASTIRWWWEEGTDGLTALTRMLAAEGPPAICFVDTNANFVFRDRHHRLIRSASTTSQATFTNGGSTETASTVTFSQPMTYDTGWRDIVNTIIVPVDQRDQRELGVVWQTDATIAVPAGSTTTVIAQAGDPFMNAVTPVAGTDFTLLTGTATASLSRTSGQSTAITLTDSGSGSLVTGLQLRAHPVTVSRTVQVNVSSPTSANAYGVRGLPSGIDLGAAGATVEDVVAVASIFVARYAQRQPIVTIPVANLNDKRLTQQLARDLSDRVHITDSETGLNADFFIEQISHATSGHGRVLVTTFGCEKADATSPSNLFTFDDATNGKFNTGKFGT